MPFIIERWSQIKLYGRFYEWMLNIDCCLYFIYYFHFFANTLEPLEIAPRSFVLKSQHTDTNLWLCNLNWKILCNCLGLHQNVKIVWIDAIRRNTFLQCLFSSFSHFLDSPLLLTYSKQQFNLWLELVNFHTQNKSNE